MIQRIILDDFLAHKHTELALGPGVTVLTGPNNSGKSAMVEALRCVATNPPPRHFIRHERDPGAGGGRAGGRNLRGLVP